MTSVKSEAKVKRGKGGRFQKGTKPGPGNPMFKQMRAYRDAITNAFSEAHVVQVVEAMRQTAMSGEKDAVPAARVFLEYTAGKPRQEVDLNVQERKLPLVPIPAPEPSEN